jgi:hypothetical protein
MMKDAQDYEVSEGKEKDQFVWLAKAKKELSCGQETELQQEEETEMTERLESTKKQQKSGHERFASNLRRPENKSEESPRRRVV